MKKTVHRLYIKILMDNVLDQETSKLSGQSSDLAYTVVVFRHIKSMYLEHLTIIMQVIRTRIIV